MAKWSGKVGYVLPVQIERGDWSTVASERIYFGDTIRNRNKVQPVQDSTNSYVNIACDISIVADTFANENLGYMKYVEYRGRNYNITDAEVLRPRIILTIGGIYNGK